MTPPQQKIARLARGERSMFAVGVLVCLTLFGIAGLLFFSREYANQRQAEAETAAVTAALEEYVRRRRQREIVDLFGKVEYDEGYDYKALRDR